MIREFLRKAFPISKTQEERRKTVGWCMRSFLDKNRTLSASTERYLALLATATIFRISLLVGGVLLAFFTCLSFKGFDPTPYVHAFYPHDRTLVAQSGIGGLYLYYYTKIMEPVVYLVASVCFILFLVHFRKGEVDVFRKAPDWFKNDRTPQNLRRLFVRVSFFPFIIVYFVLHKTNVGCLGFLLYFPDLFRPITHHFLGWVFLYACMNLVQFGLVAVLYASMMLGWSIIFRYDVPENKQGNVA